MLFLWGKKKHEKGLGRRVRRRAGHWASPNDRPSGDGGMRFIEEVFRKGPDL